jgi:hypothetical protein
MKNNVAGATINHCTYDVFQVAILNCSSIGTQTMHKQTSCYQMLFVVLDQNNKTNKKHEKFLYFL